MAMGGDGRMGLCRRWRSRCVCLPGCVEWSRRVLLSKAQRRYASARCLRSPSRADRRACTSECKMEETRRWTGRRRELPALSFAFARVSVPASGDEFRTRVWAGHRYSHPEPSSSKPDTSLAQRTHDTFAPSPPLAALPWTALFHTDTRKLSHSPVSPPWPANLDTDTPCHDLYLNTQCRSHNQRIPGGQTQTPRATMNARRQSYEVHHHFNNRAAKTQGSSVVHQLSRQTRTGTT